MAEKDEKIILMNTALYKKIRKLLPVSIGISPLGEKYSSQLFQLKNKKGDFVDISNSLNSKTSCNINFVGGLPGDPGYEVVYAKEIPTKKMTIKFLKRLMEQFEEWCSSLYEE